MHIPEIGAGDLIPVPAAQAFPCRSVPRSTTSSRATARREGKGIAQGHSSLHSIRRIVPHLWRPPMKKVDGHEVSVLLVPSEKRPPHPEVTHWDCDTCGGQQKAEWRKVEKVWHKIAPFSEALVASPDTCGTRFVFSRSPSCLRFHPNGICSSKNETGASAP